MASCPWPHIHVHGLMPLASCPWPHGHCLMSMALRFVNCELNCQWNPSVNVITSCNAAYASQPLSTSLCLCLSLPLSASLSLSLFAFLCLSLPLTVAASLCLILPLSASLFLSLPLCFFSVGA